MLSTAGWKIVSLLYFVCASSCESNIAYRVVDENSYENKIDVMNQYIFAFSISFGIMVALSIIYFKIKKRYPKLLPLLALSTSFLMIIHDLVAILFKSYLTPRHTSLKSETGLRLSRNNNDEKHNFSPPQTPALFLSNDGRRSSVGLISRAPLSPFLYQPPSPYNAEDQGDEEEGIPQEYVDFNKGGEVNDLSNSINSNVTKPQSSYIPHLNK
ncbi:8436_t:CDS:2 [Funneliformis geosporum]|uniref:8436_t:CDS:1 n=1 Tax=Funneliformis geosporum TaxID=1117311 RepID=A0A9W4SQM2_9GLOM|nr:8436_t:CDS:2 [Funneliformis geosporum]